MRTTSRIARMTVDLQHDAISPRVAARVMDVIHAGDKRIVLKLTEQ